MTGEGKTAGMAEHEGIRQALGRIPSGIFVAGAVHEGRRVGMLCSFVEQAGFEPPMIMLAFGKGRPMADLLAAGTVFGLNILGEDAKRLMAAFVHPDPADAFAGHELVPNTQGLPELAGAIAFLACRPRNHTDAGDHTVFVAEVLDGRLHGDGGAPMIRLRKNGLNY